ncbi:MAG TPA: thiolase, partial [Gammaproteobacteria bacterium]|nr:thiolase [Gammaproteobacteria bacterium]
MSNKTPVIAGVADVPLVKGKVLNGENVMSIQANAALEALDSAGLTLADVDGLMVTGMWAVPGPGQLMSVTMAEYLGIQPTFHDCTNIGGSTFELFVARAALAIEAGQAETVLILYGSTQKSERSRNLAGRAPVFNMQYETPYGMPTPVGGYAMAMQRHMHEYGSTPETLAEIAVATRKWAKMNDNATSRDDLTIDEVMESPVISSPLRLRDCCLVT